MGTMLGKDVLSTSFFEEDFQAFNNQLDKNEELYEEVHDLYAQATGGEGATFKMMRDVSEVSKTLASIRATSIEAVNKRFQMKRSVADLEQKKKQNEKEDSNAAEIARAAIMAIRSDLALSKPITTSAKSNAMGKDKLKERINSELNNNIKLSDNDKAMKYAYKGVEVVYNKQKNKYMAIAKGGELIENYPQDRIPDTKIVKEENGFVITNGGKYRII